MLRNLVVVIVMSVLLSGCVVRTHDANPVPDVTNNAQQQTQESNDKESETEGNKPVVSYEASTQLQLEEVLAISTKYAQSHQLQLIENDRYEEMIDGLNQLDESIAKDQSEEAAVESVMILVETESTIYELPYDLATNRLRIGEEWVYAHYSILLVMNGLLHPELEVAVLDALLEDRKTEFAAQSTVADTAGLTAERATLDNKDYLAWEAELNRLEAKIKLTYFNTATERLEALSIYNEGIIAFNQEILFSEALLTSTDGIHIGLMKDEVKKRLGEANIALQSYWGYKVGDYVKFHLYFADDKVTWISLSMPL